MLTLLIALTGWCLRPPVMIALVLNKMPSIPGTTLHSKNPWNDKLRVVRYDEKFGDWLLSTSDGFFSVNFQTGKLESISNTPPVSVMGLNVLQQNKDGKWYCGSFSGLFVWDRVKGTTVDYSTGKAALKNAGAPFGKMAIAGIDTTGNVIQYLYPASPSPFPPSELYGTKIALDRKSTRLNSSH